jgi:glycosyltransferase involved in cell wall biosynthesis
MGGFPSNPNLPHGRNTKGGETLLAAWKAAEDELAAASASLLVANLAAPDEHAARWQKSLKHPDLVDLAGPLAPSTVASYMRAADVVLVPSLQEGLPNVAMEASACGRAVFASAVGGLPDIVVPGQTGLLLPAGDVGAWGEAMAQYAKRASELKLMAQAARVRMERLFDAQQYAIRMKELYLAVLRH